MKTMIIVCAMALAVASCNCNNQTNESTPNTNTQPEVENSSSNASGEERKGSRYDTVYLEPERVGEGTEIRKDTLNDEDGTTGGVDSTHRRSGGKGTPHP